jgi:hypothetical protein
MEMQRRLKAWQYPDSKEPIGKKAYHKHHMKNSIKKNYNNNLSKVGDDTRNNTEIKSPFDTGNTEINPPFDTGRSCENSKFLLFEPPSGHIYICICIPLYLDVHVYFYVLCIYTLCLFGFGLDNPTFF